MGAGDTMSLGSDTLTWDAVVQELHVSSVEHDKVSFAVDWPYFMQNSGDSSALSPKKESVSQLQLWGSVMLTKDKEAVCSMIQQQTQAGHLVRLEPSQRVGRRKVVVLRNRHLDAQEAQRADVPEQSHASTNSSASASAFQQLASKNIGAPQISVASLVVCTNLAATPRTHNEAGGSSGAAATDGGYRAGSLLTGNRSPPDEEGFGDSSNATGSKRKVMDEHGKVMDEYGSACSKAAISEGSGIGDADDPPTSDQGARRGAPSCTRHNITWFMALQDATTPGLPQPDLHKLMQLSYDDDDTHHHSSPHLDGKYMTDQQMGTSDMKPTTRARVEHSRTASLLRSLYTGTLDGQCFGWTLTFGHNTHAEAAYYVTMARAWARQQATVHFVFMMMVMMGMVFTMIPDATRRGCVLLDQHAPALVSRAMRMVGDAASGVAEVLLETMASVLSLPRNALAAVMVPSVGAVTWRWVAAHMALHVGMCCPLYVLRLLPEAYHVLLLEPMTQVVHVTMFVVHSWCPMSACLWGRIPLSNLMPNSWMLCRSWLYVSMFPTRWCRAMWTQAMLLAFVLVSLALHPNCATMAPLPPMVQIADDWMCTTLPALGGVLTGVLMVVRWVCGFVERALPWLLQMVLQCVWLYVSELASRSAYLVRTSSSSSAGLSS